MAALRGAGRRPHVSIDFVGPPTPSMDAYCAVVQCTETGRELLKRSPIDRTEQLSHVLLTIVAQLSQLPPFDGLGNELVLRVHGELVVAGDVQTAFHMGIGGVGPAATVAEFMDRRDAQMEAAATVSSHEAVDDAQVTPRGSRGSGSGPDMSCPKAKAQQRVLKTKPMQKHRRRSTCVQACLKSL